MGHFLPIMKWVVFFEAAGAVSKIGSSQKSNHWIKLSLSKSMIHILDVEVTKDWTNNKTVYNTRQYNAASYLDLLVRPNWWATALSSFVRRVRLGNESLRFDQTRKFKKTKSIFFRILKNKSQLLLKQQIKVNEIESQNCWRKNNSFLRSIKKKKIQKSRKKEFLMFRSHLEFVTSVLKRKHKNRSSHNQVKLTTEYFLERKKRNDQASIANMQ